MSRNLFRSGEVGLENCGPGRPGCSESMAGRSGATISYMTFCFDFPTQIAKWPATPRGQDVAFSCEARALRCSAAERAPRAGPQTPWH